DKKGRQDGIPGKPFGEGALFINAYYQGPLALFKIGESIGHPNLMKIIADVFNANSNPTFSDFERLFMAEYGDKADIWRKAWRL
ncbi:MAG: hypothetical protein HUU37_03755, partial [Bdellovibrionales bacterium]|nr:hypothetical protein [Bdellovibrionales bacterium]